MTSQDPFEPPTPSGAPRLLVTSFSCSGSRSQDNQDSLVALDGRSSTVRQAAGGCLFAVADGVGSVPGSGDASRRTCDTLFGLFVGPPPNAARLLDVVALADAQVREHGGACTLAGVWLQGAVCSVFSVGDSAVLRARRATVERLTRADVRGRGLSAYVGMGPQVRQALQLRSLELQPGDVYLVCSDGLLDTVGDEGVRAAWYLGGCAAGWAAELEAILLGRGHRDDASAVVVQVLALPEVV